MTEQPQLMIPKIVRWGIRMGGTNSKVGNFIQAYQPGTGKNKNSSSRKRGGGKVYRNAKLERLSLKGTLSWSPVAKRIKK